jgi:hypothetical protein
MNPELIKMIQRTTNAEVMGEHMHCLCYCLLAIADELAELRKRLDGVITVADYDR